jgi:hypothetical protein
MRETIAAWKMQTRCGGLDDVERGVDLRALVEGNAHKPGEEAVVILEGQWGRRKRRRGGSHFRP